MNNNCGNNFPILNNTISNIQNTINNLGSRISELEVYKLNLPYSITNYVGSCPNALINWNTVLANPSNVKFERVWNITVDATLKSIASQYVFTYLPTIVPPPFQFPLKVIYQELLVITVVCMTHQNTLLTRMSRILLLL